MKYIVKTLGLITAAATVSGAFAATSRVGTVGRVSPRLPSIAGFVSSGSTLRSAASTTSYMADVDCIDSYTDCIKANDACGSDFEECTTNVLFHGQMSKCLSVLYQCNASGVNALFGTSAINALSNVESYETIDGVQEVSKYTYPTDGSVLGQLIIGAGITNRLNTEQCVRRYTNCLKRDDICGEDFELCTDQKEFKKQALLCDSTLARCQNDGKIQLFGSVAKAKVLDPESDSRLGKMIEDGASLAALNAVKTCNKVVDNCLVNSCAKNPFRCVEGVSLETINTAEIISGGKDKVDTFQTAVVKNEDGTVLSSASDVRKLIKTQCLETIGSNKYCHMTYLEKMPSKRELGDPELQEEVFSLAYAARKGYANTKIQEAIKKFDTDTKNKCIDTISSCVMRSCGGGIGSVCYSLSKDDDKTKDIAVNNTRTYPDIKAGCSAIVNSDANCIYAATAGGTDGYEYSYTTNSVFTKLFPEATTGSDSTTDSDPIGAVASLNTLLATSYNDAAIARMKKQCANVAVSCVKSMCGTDYTNCYRNRTDIIAGTYNTSSTKLDKSMNKVGGVLDYNIVMGLCMNTVQNSSVCEEHLKITASKVLSSTDDADTTTWGGKSSVRSAWLGANSTKVGAVYAADEVLVACAIPEDKGSDKCPAYSQAAPVNEDNCDGVMDDNGCLYTEPVTQKKSQYVLKNAGTTLFQEVLADVEREVQAQYNAKLTHEQNVCLANNTGGVRGVAENGSTFMWVKLKGNKIPRDYVSKGLSTKEFTASNDLYGSFCRVRVTVGSNDQVINEELGEKATAYFAVGDAFTCGSWIDSKTLERITKKVAENAIKQSDVAQGSAKYNAIMGWAPVVGLLGGGIGGYFGMDALQKKGSSLGGLIGTSTSDSNTCNDKVASAISEVEAAEKATSNSEATRHYNNAVSYANSAKSAAKAAGQNVDKLTFSAKAYTAGTSGTSAEYAWTGVAAAARAARDASALSYEKATDENDCATASDGFDDLAEELDEAPDNKRAAEIWKNNFNKYVSMCSGIGGWDFDLSVIETSAGSAGTSESYASTSDIAELRTGVEKLKSLCSAAKSSSETKRRNANLIAGAAMGAVGTALGVGIAKTVLDVKRQGIADEAVKQWMEEIGDKIQCYAGTEELGSYGDPVLLEID